MGELGPHGAGEDVWKEQRERRIYVRHKRTERKERMMIHRGGMKQEMGIATHGKQ